MLRAFLRPPSAVSAAAQRAHRGRLFLLAEVPECQLARGRKLLRISILERVGEALAGLLTAGSWSGRLGAGSRSGGSASGAPCAAPAVRRA
jgi:hypothetical protein